MDDAAQRRICARYLGRRMASIRRPLSKYTRYLACTRNINHFEITEYDLIADHSSILPISPASKPMDEALYTLSFIPFSAI